MPENNKVMYDGQVVMDISDSTLSTDNMLQGVVGYSGAGVRTVGTLNPVKWEQQNILGSKNLNSYPYADAFPGNQLSVYYDDLGDGRVMANGINNYNTSPSWCMLHSCVDGLDMISGSNSYLWVNNLILPNGTYTLNGCPQGGSASTYYLEVGSLQSGAIVEYGKDTGNGFTFTLNGDDYSQDEVRLHLRIVVCDHVQVTNLIFAPMIRLSSITDDTFEPYARTNYDETQKSALWSELNLLGAKNLLSPDYNGSITGDTSVTFTVNSDGSVTINGTTNALTSFCLKGSNDGFKLPAGHFYALSGGHDGVNVSVTVTSKIRGHALSISKVSTDNKDALFTVGDNLYNLELYIKIPSGTVCNNITIKPMIRLGSISDNTWQPYTYTNREITDKFLTETMGHNIKNPSGTTMTKRDNLKFSDSHISDDSTNNQTIVDIVKEVTTAQWNNATEEGLYYINDKPDSIITAEQVAYDNSQNTKQKIDEVDGKVGLTNLTSAYFSHTTGTDKYYIGHNVDSSKAGQVTIDTDGLHILIKNSGTWAEKYVLKPFYTDTVQITTGSTQWNGFYYGDKTNLSSNIIIDSVMVMSSGSNPPAFAMIVNGSNNNIRVLSPTGASTQYTVKYLYHLA